jgi:hypothetical protein
MKTKAFTSLLLFVLALSVNAQKKQPQKKTDAKIDITASLVLLGTWEGEMSGKKLTIIIEKIDANNSLRGYNILGTNKRALKGSFKPGDWDQPCSKAFDVTLNEPGDDKWDGVFTIKFVGYEDEAEGENGPVCKGNLKGSEARGKWNSNNKKSAKDFELKKIK